MMSTNPFPPEVDHRKEDLPKDTEGKDGAPRPIHPEDEVIAYSETWRKELLHRHAQGG